MQEIRSSNPPVVTAICNPNKSWAWQHRSFKLDSKLKYLNLIFFLHPVPFYGQDYGKQKEPGTSYQFLFELQNMFRKIPFLVIYHLGNFDDLIQSGFWA